MGPRHACRKAVQTKPGSISDLLAILAVANASLALWLLSGLYLILQAVLSLGLADTSPAAFDHRRSPPNPKHWRPATASMGWRLGLGGCVGRCPGCADRG